MNIYSRRPGNLVKTLNILRIYKIILIISILLSFQSCTTRPQTQRNITSNETNTVIIPETVKVYIPETIFVTVKDTLKLDSITLEAFLVKLNRIKKRGRKKSIIKYIRNGDKLFLKRNSIKYLGLNVRFRLSSNQPTPCCKCSLLPVRLSVITDDENSLITKEYETRLGKEISLSLPLDQLLSNYAGKKVNVTIEIDRTANNKCELEEAYEKSIKFSINIIKGIEIDDSIYFSLGKAVILTSGDHMIRPVISGPDSNLDFSKIITIKRGSTKYIRFTTPTGESIKLRLKFQIGRIPPKKICRNVLLKVISLEYSNGLVQTRKFSVRGDTIILKNIKLPPIENKFELISGNDTIYRNTKGIFPGKNVIPVKINCSYGNPNKRLIFYGLDTLYLDYLSPHKDINVFYKPGLVLTTNGEVLFNITCGTQSKQVRLSVDRQKYVELGKLLKSRRRGVCKLKILEKR